MAQIDTNLPAKAGYSVGDFCRALGIGRTTLYRLLNSGEVPARKVGGRTIVTISPEDYLARGREYAPRAAREAA